MASSHATQMGRALIFDIHRSLDALDAVLEDIEKQGIQEIYCLGDLTGFGPDPVACLDLAQTWNVVLRAHHDEWLVQRPSWQMNPQAMSWLEWVRTQLRAGGPSVEADRMDFLRQLPVLHQEGPVLHVHGSPRDPLEYLLGEQTIDENASLVDHLCFHGHTHKFAAVWLEGTDREEYVCGVDPLSIQREGKYIIGVGSVGQPHDGDARAAYVMWSGDSVQFRRVPYDIKKTQDKMRALDMPWPDISRLSYGR